MITHTASYKNAMTNNPQYIGAKHCQAGSSILVYDFRVCEGDCEISERKL